MQIYLAPMEGITGHTFRNNLEKHFGGIDVYMTPFIPASKNLSKKQIRDVSPEHNLSPNLVPQLIGNRADEFIEMCEKLKKYGYREFNLNLGCPSGTVTSKKRGSGFLPYPEEMDAMFAEIFSSIEDGNDIKVSVKSRIGFESVEEWDSIVSVYKKYPFSELIIHPRLRKEFYSGTPHYDAFLKAVEEIPVPLVYNGDITSVSSYNEVANRFPTIDRFMIGRGLLEKPALAAVLKGGTPPTKEQLKAYHDDLIEEYLKLFSGPRDMIFHMKEVWSYFRHSFVDCDKYWKKLKKATDLEDYRFIVNQIFKNCELEEY